MNTYKNHLGRTEFVKKYDLRCSNESEHLDTTLKNIEDAELDVIRLSFPDQHGILRGKSIAASEVLQAMHNGCTSTTTLLAKDTAHKTVFPVFSPGGGFNIPEMSNAGDFIMVPLPSTFRILPWLSKTGWMLCDIYLSNGKPVPYSTRKILKSSLNKIESLGLEYIVGLEVEMHIYRLKDPKLDPVFATQPPTPPEVELLAHGFNYLTEIRMDEFEPILNLIQNNLKSLGIPIRTMEVEFGPSQVELTFEPSRGIEAADNMMLVKNAVKQICRRNGYHATFMCKPNLENSFPSGWHLHQSLIKSSDSSNAMMPEQDGKLLSPLGESFVAGLLKHAKAASLLTTPTINGYKRYKPNSLAPNRIVWGKDNKGAMLRVITSGVGDISTHLENRVGEPAANPYLYLTSQILSGLDGINENLQPQPPTDDPYASRTDLLPTNLMDAVVEFKNNKMFKKELGKEFVDYIVYIKEAEIERFFSEVTDWEQKEYFELF